MIEISKILSPIRLLNLELGICAHWMCKYKIYNITSSFLFVFVITAAIAAERNDSLSGKIIVGYQGWYGCRGEDGSSEFSHWQEKGNLVVPLLPDMRNFSESDKCHLDVKGPDGTPFAVFSSANYNVVNHHFKIMASHGIGIVALQRFASVLKNNERLKFANMVLRNAVKASHENRLKFFIEYDLSGVKGEDVQIVIDDMLKQYSDGVVESEDYQFEGAHPLFGFWGLGFAGRPWTPDQAVKLLETAKKINGGVSLMLGVPSWWRTGGHDASADAGWREVFRKADVINPWTVARFADKLANDRFVDSVMKPDIAWTRDAGISYLPVVFPGTASPSRKSVYMNGDVLGLQDSDPQCGAFLDHQIGRAVEIGAKAIFVAMFDEVNEGTAIMPTRDDLNMEFGGVRVAPRKCGVDGADSNALLKVVKEQSRRIAKLQ